MACDTFAPLPSLEVWKTFRDRFSTDYFDILANDTIKVISKWDKDMLFSSAPILMFGIDGSLLKLFTRTLLCRIFQTNVNEVPKDAEYQFTNGSVKCIAKYSYTANYIEIDMSRIGSGEKTFITEFLYKHIGSTKHINQEKHVVVLHNVHTMTSLTWFSLRRPLEMLSKNVIFIMTTPTLNKIDATIRSRMMHVKATVGEEAMGSFFEVFVDKMEINDGIDSEKEIELDSQDHLSYNILLLSRYLDPTYTLTTNNVDTKIVTFLDEILKETNLLKVVERIRAFGYKILHFNVPLAYIMKITIEYVAEHKKFKKKNDIIQEVIALSANLEHKSLSIHRPILVFENYFLKLYKLLCIK
jgi:hypothetical protein